MAEMMTFPETFDKFVEEYGFVDEKEVYTNGSELIQVFRVKQWLDHEAGLKKAEDKRSVGTAVSIYLHGSLADPSLGSWRVASAVIAVLLLAAEDMDAAAKTLAVTAS